MSGILNRMAKRALGSLPGIQPVTSPQFAQLGWSDSPKPLETHLEADAPSPSAPRPHSARQIAPVSTHFVVPAPSGPRVEHAAPAHEPAPGSRLENPLENQKETGAPAPALETEASPSRHDEPSPEPAGTPARYAAQREPHQEPPLDPVEVLRAEHAEVPRQRARRNDPSASPTPTPRRQAAPSREPLPTAEQKTEIHISIGSIELRAPRNEARPAAPPFRPRVTLDQFLRRKPEAHS